MNSFRWRARKKTSPRFAGTIFAKNGSYSRRPLYSLGPHHIGARKVCASGLVSDMATTTTAKVRGFAVSSAGANRWLVFFCFFSIYIIWGSTYLAIRDAVETLPPLYTAGKRHLVAGSILLAWCAAKKLRPTREQLRASVVIGFLFFLMGHGSLHWAEQVVPSGRAALLIAIEPILVFLLASAASRTWRWNGLLAAGILLGLAGVGVLVQGSISAPPVAGIGAGFGSGLG